MLRARTGWTTARTARVWAVTAAAALAGTGRGALGHASGLGARMTAGHGHGWVRARTRAWHWGLEAV